MSEKGEEIELEKHYPAVQMAPKLRRLADCLESGEAFRIMVDGKRIYVPADAYIDVEYEAADGKEELEFEIKWSSK